MGSGPVEGPIRKSPKPERYESGVVGQSRGTSDTRRQQSPQIRVPQKIPEEESKIRNEGIYQRSILLLPDDTAELKSHTELLGGDSRRSSWRLVL